MIAFVEHNTSHAHKQLLHQGFHLVEHQHTPHALHGLGALVAILVVVHLLAMGFILYLFMRTAEPADKSGRRRGPGKGRDPMGNRGMAAAAAAPPPPPPPIRCVADHPGGAVLWQR